MSQEPARNGPKAFLGLLLALLLAVILAWLAWRLRLVLLFAFGSVLLGFVFHLAAGALRRWLRLPSAIALPAALVIILGLPIFAIWNFGAEIGAQADLIRKALPQALYEAETFLGDFVPQMNERSLAEMFGGSQIFSGLAGMLVTTADATANFVVVLVAAVYFAADPGLYRRGLRTLIPPRYRDLSDLTLKEISVGLELWLKGRLVAMVLVGALTSLGLYLIGVPSYLALGILAGMLEFIPFVGPILAGIPAVLLALLGGPVQSLLVVALYAGIQQLEGNLITPLIQRHVVHLPPALLIFAVLGFGLLFGLAGVILAAPLTVVLFILVKRIYVREFLDTRTQMPGEDSGEDSGSRT